MSCCGVTIEAHRNADLRKTYAPRGRNYTFSGFSPLMQIRDGATVLLTISLSATANGSVFSVVSDALALTLKKADVLALASGPGDRLLSYDIVLSQGGIESWFVGGDFIVLDINATTTEGEQSVTVDLDGQSVDVTIMGGNIGIGASVLLADLNSAVESAEQSADDAASSLAAVPGLAATAGAAAGAAAGTTAGATAGTSAGSTAGTAAANVVVEGKANIDGGLVQAQPFRNALGLGNSANLLQWGSGGFYDGVSDKQAAFSQTQPTYLANGSLGALYCQRVVSHTGGAASYDDAPVNGAVRGYNQVQSAVGRTVECGGLFVGENSSFLAQIVGVAGTAFARLGSTGWGGVIEVIEVPGGYTPGNPVNGVVGAEIDVTVNSGTDLFNPMAGNRQGAAIVGRRADTTNNVIHHVGTLLNLYSSPGDVYLISDRGVNFEGAFDRGIDFTAPNASFASHLLKFNGFGAGVTAAGNLSLGNLGTADFPGYASIIAGNTVSGFVGVFGDGVHTARIQAGSAGGVTFGSDTNIDVLLKRNGSPVLRLTSRNIGLHIENAASVTKYANNAAALEGGLVVGDGYLDTSGFLHFVI